MSYVAQTSDGFFDKMDKDEKRLAKRSLILLGRILSEADTSGFTFREIDEGFNSQVPYVPESHIQHDNPDVHAAPIRFKEDHLEFLVQKGFLEKDQDGIYSVVDLPADNAASTNDEEDDGPQDPLGDLEDE